MANFTALKTAINNAIKTNGNEEITGAVLQVILDAMVETLGESAITNLENALAAEVTNRENAVGGVADDLAAEVQARQALDYNVNNRINAEEYNRQNADAALSQTMSQGFQTLGSQMTALNAAISALNAAYQNGYLYGGIATPSSSPSNNKCFYIALQGGTYTNFGGVGVVEGINIIKNDSGWKVEHIYDQTTLLNEFYLLRQQVIQAIASFTPIVIQGDVTNAPDEEDLTSNANHLLQFKNNAYSPLEFSGLGRKYLRKNIAPLSESAPFNGFVEGVNAEETLSGTPTHIFWDRINTRFVGIKDGVYYLDWTDSDNYVPVSTSLVYMYNGTPYQWTGSDFIVDETEVPNLVNCLTQDMINEANTIYIIRYDYTLKENITIPAGCVLQFDGGSISGEHTINVGGTLIRGYHCIYSNVTLTGVCANDDILVEWFIGTDLEKIQAAMDYANRSYYRDSSSAGTAYKASYKKVVFSNQKQYVIDGSINLPFYADIEGNNAMIKTTSTANIMQTPSGGTGSFITNIRNLTLLGDDVCGLYLNVGNLDNSFTTLTNLTFETDTKTIDKFGIYLYNISSQCVIERCTARRCPNFLKVRCDSLIIRDCWINGYTAGGLKPDNTCSIELSEGCRYTRIENCQFVPEGDGSGLSKNTRWIDWKGGRISVANCIFGGENAGLPIFWKYTNDRTFTLSLCDSQIACSGAKNRSGLVTLMNNVLPGDIRIKNVFTPYARVINPYGYVKENIADDTNDNYNSSAIQQAWDLLIDKILKTPVPTVVGNIDLNLTNFDLHYIPYPLLPYIPSYNKGYLNNVDTTKAYKIAKNLLDSANVNNRIVAVDAMLEIFVSGRHSVGGQTWYVKYRFRYSQHQRYNIGDKSVTLVDKFGTTISSNIDSSDHVTVTLDSDFNMNISVDDAAYTPVVAEYKFVDLDSYDTDNFKGPLPVYLLPQKCLMDK